MDSIITKNINEIREYCKNHDVESLYAFGSVATEDFNDNSDIDLLISFKDIPIETYTDNYFLLINLFQDLFKRHVDLLTEKSLSNPYFIKSIEKTKILLYGR